MDQYSPITSRFAARTARNWVARTLALTSTNHSA